MNYPTTDEFDQDTAKHLLENGGTLIIEGFPSGCEFGIDLSVNYTADKFMGYKLIPPGIHYVYFNYVKQNNSSPRIGFFTSFHKGQIICMRWNDSKEDLEDCSIEQTERLKDAFYNNQLDSFLATFQYSKYQTWMSLSDCISPEQIKNINPKCGKVFSASQLVYPSEESRILRKCDSEGLPDMVISPECRLRFAANIPSRFLVPNQSSAKEISEHSMDSSFTLECVINDCFGTDETKFLGELQYAFIAVFLGHVFEAFEHWRDMMKIVCNSKTALVTRPEFYLNFIRVCHFQLQQADQELFADIVENQNIVYCYLQSLFMNISNIGDHINQQVDRLKDRADRFQASLKKSLKWSFDDEPDDEKPMIVET